MVRYDKREATTPYEEWLATQPGSLEKLNYSKSSYFRAPSSHQSVACTVDRWFAKAPVWTTDMEYHYKVGVLDYMERIGQWARDFVPKTLERAVYEMNLSASAGNDFDGVKRTYFLKEFPEVRKDLAWFLDATPQECSERFIWKGIMKDEILPRKLKKFWAPREVFCCPPVLNLATNICCGTLLDWCISNWYRLPCRQGFSKFNGEVASIFKMFEGQEVSYYDVRNQESSFNEFVHRTHAQGHNLLLKTQLQREMREKIAYCNSHWWVTHPDGRLGLVEGFNPSGSGLTIHDNGIEVYSVQHAALSALKWDHSKVNQAIVGDNDMIGVPKYTPGLGKFPWDHFETKCREYFPFELEGRSDNVYDLEFCSVRVPHRYAGPVASNPDKMVTKLLFTATDPAESAVVAGNILNEIYGTISYYSLNSYIDWLEATYGVASSRATPAALRVLYRPANMRVTS